MAYKKTAHRRRRVRSSRRKNAKSRKVMRGGARDVYTGNISYNGGVYTGRYEADETTKSNPLPETIPGEKGTIRWIKIASLDKKWPTKTSYCGEWRKGKMSGYGEMEYPNKKMYKGKWHDDTRHGVGSMHFPHGTIFSGIWDNDNPTGDFTVTELNGGSSVIKSDRVDDYEFECPD